jgi:tubulin alpha
MKEVISIHLGQAGVQIGNSSWELFSLEHGISKDGKVLEQSLAMEDDNFKTFFTETEKGKFEPRAFFIDLEPNVIDEIRTGEYKDLFNSDLLINDKSDAANNFARGYYTLGGKLISLTIDRIRKNVEKCSNFDGFMIFNSASGGTGSGFGSLLLEKLAVEFPKKDVISQLIYPSPDLSNSVVEPYNCIFSSFYQTEQSNVTTLIDNEAVYDICRRQLEIEIPNFRDLNCIISQVNSSMTASMRFGGCLNQDLKEFSNNLVPFPRVHFIITSFSPIVNSKKTLQDPLSTAEITNNVFDPHHTLTKCDPRLGKYMSCCLLFRGHIVPKDIMAAVASIKTKRTIQFVDWGTAGFKCCLNPQEQTVTPGSILSKHLRSVCMLGNNSSVVQVFSRMDHKFDLMYSKRAFVHWYTSEGMEETEFVNARENMAALEKDYEEIDLEIEEEEEEDQ